MSGCSPKPWGDQASQWVAFLMSGKKRSLVIAIPTLKGGGAERVTATLLRHLDREKFDISLAVVDCRAAAYLDDLPNDIRFPCV